MSSSYHHDDAPPVPSAGPPGSLIFAAYMTDDRPLSALGRRDACATYHSRGRARPISDPVCSLCVEMMKPPVFCFSYVSFCGYTPKQFHSPGLQGGQGFLSRAMQPLARSCQPGYFTKALFTPPKRSSRARKLSSAVAQVPKLFAIRHRPGLSWEGDVCREA